MMHIQHQIFDQLLSIIPDLQTRNKAGKSKLESKSMMDLILDILDKKSNSSLIALSHYYKHQSGDRIADPELIDARYRITLSKTIGGVMLAWQTRLTAGSQQEAVDVAKRLFKKQRGEIQDAIMHQWELRDVTPLAQRKN